MMKFITEEYLRDLYRKEPFNTYKLQHGQRLTPGAAQYLSDKGIRMNDNASKLKKNCSQNNQAEKIKEVVNSGSNLKKKLCCKLKSIEAAFLVTSSEILRDDILLAQNIINLGRKLGNMRNAIDGKGSLETIDYKVCIGIDSLNFTADIDDCFEITEFHMQLEKSNAILKMHTLRCVLQELKFEIIESYEDENDLKNRIMENVNSIINSLSQLICSAVGGKECQRKG